jgi:hypothetical protein
VRYPGRTFFAAVLAAALLLPLAAAAAPGLTAGEGTTDYLAIATSASGVQPSGAADKLKPERRDIFSWHPANIIAFLLLVAFIIVMEKVNSGFWARIHWAAVGLIAVIAVLSARMAWFPTTCWTLGVLLGLLAVAALLVSIMTGAASGIIRWLPRWMGWVLLPPAAAAFLGSVILACAFCWGAMSFSAKYERSGQATMSSETAAISLGVFVLLISACFLVAHLGWAVCAAVYLRYRGRADAPRVSRETPACPICGLVVGKRNRHECFSCGRTTHRRNCSAELDDGSRVCSDCREHPRSEDEKEPQCPICERVLGTRSSYECPSCGESVHTKRCTVRSDEGPRICKSCFAAAEEEGADDCEDQDDEIEESDSAEDQDDAPDEPLPTETEAVFGPAEQMLAVKLNRLFAACRSLRARRPEGYDQARARLDDIRDELSLTPARMQLIESHVREMSGGTFHWDP